MQTEWRLAEWLKFSASTAFYNCTLLIPWLLQWPRQQRPAPTLDC